MDKKTRVGKMEGKGNEEVERDIREQEEIATQD